MPGTNLIDLKVSFDHDLMINGGDIATTIEEPKQAILQYIRYKIATVKSGEQVTHFEDKFLGKKNTRELGNDMALELRLLLTEDGLINSNELTVTPFPLSRTAIGFKLSIIFFDDINTQFTPTNVSELISFVAFNTSDGALYALS